MINSITGIVTGKSEYSLLLLNGGIEWEAVMGQIAISRMPPVGSECRIFCYLHHKEDSMKLFGFYSKQERELFLDLIKVNGVGPSLAIKILSGMDIEALVTALDAGDDSSLSKISGLGKKTAQKIILALRGKISLESGEPSSDIEKDVIQALIDMGFDRRKAKDAVSAVSAGMKIGPGEPEYEKELFRLGLQRLSGG